MLLGILVVFGSSVCNSVGLIVEKRALDRLPPIDVRAPVRMAVILLRRPLWLFGFALLLLGALLQIRGLSLLPLTIAQPLFAVGLAVVLVVAAVVLREPLSAGEYRGLAAMAVAFVLLALSMDSRTDRVGTSQHPIAFTAVVVPAAVVSVAVFTAADRTARRRHRQASPGGIAFGVTVGLMNGVGGLCAKGSATQLAGHGTRTSALALTPYPYLLGVSAILMLGMTQTALQRCRTALFIPVQVVVGNLAVTVAGTAVFDEHLPDTPVRLGLRIAGLLVAVVSLAVMQRGPRRARGRPGRPRRRGRPNAARRPSPGRARRGAAARKPDTSLVPGITMEGRPERRAT